MQRRICLGFAVLVCSMFSLVTFAYSPTSWTPARILGMMYPQVARFARIEGVVEAKCKIREDGTVADVMILTGHPMLAPAVKDNLLKWTLRRVENNRGDTKDFAVKYTFQLKGDCDAHRGCKEEFWYEPPDRVTVVSELPRINTGSPVLK